jgi:hypothetical protein
MKSTEFSVEVGAEVFTLDLADLRFTDATLNEFFERIAGRIDYVGRAVATATKFHALLVQEGERCYLKKFKEFKEQKASDKTAELFAKADPEYQELQIKAIDAKYLQNQLYHHLSALNSALSNAQNRGHMMRKEMEIGSGPVIRLPKDHGQDFDSALAEIRS